MNLLHTSPQDWRVARECGIGQHFMAVRHGTCYTAVDSLHFAGKGSKLVK